MGGDNKKASTLVEAHMGMVDRGADIGWLSQYPHEAEVLFGPLSGLEMRSTRIEGASIVACRGCDVPRGGLPHVDFPDIR